MGLTDTVGFLGFGNMGQAICKGLLDTGTMAANHLAAFDRMPERQSDAKQLGIQVYDDLLALARASGILILATKPQDMEAALDQVKPGLDSKVLIVSIAAGISIGYIQKKLGPEFRVVRVMPNTPALVNAGAAGLAMSSNCSANDAARARAIFEAVGIVETVPESMIDCVTALSGSGPAYFFYLVECMVRAATAQGMPEDQATRLASQTLTGAGLLLKQSGEPAGVLRARVTSKGGTTEVALRRFEDEGFERMVAAGVDAAAKRSRELGK